MGPFRNSKSLSLLHMKKRLIDAMADVRETVVLFQSFEVPAFERQTEYVSLTHTDVYPFYDGDLYSSDGHTIPPGAYKDAISEYVNPRSTAKYARWNRPQYMVGALARLNNNFDLLRPFAREMASELGIDVPCHNPFMNNLAQLVECAHCLKESIDIIDRLVEIGIRGENEQAPVRPRSGSGIGAVEAPRGTLFHEYAFDHDGTCVEANLVIPTAQNLGNLEADMRAYTPDIMDQEENQIAHSLEVLVRSYDPCISCSTHVIRLE